MKRLLLLCAVLLVSGTASAALDRKYDEWRNGPVQYLLTPEEQKAWKKLRTDEEAIRFIDLFWVRRDPSRETPRNEFRDEFTARVKLANAQFAEPRKEGWQTDRGRVFIVLGNPTSGGGDAFSNTGHQGTGASGASGGNRLRGAREAWMWTGADAAKFDMRTIEVVFIEEPGTGKMQRDPHRPDFMRAWPIAVRKAVVQADLDQVPEWAPTGGLEPKYVMKPEEAATIAAPAADAGSGPSPLSRLTLLRDVWSVNSELKADPFTKIAAIQAFKSSDDLGWVAQYCSGIDEEPTLRYGLRLTGTAANEVVDRVAPPDELVPDRIKASPGCYLMRGMIPLEGMMPGAYALEVSIEDPKTKATWAVKQEFAIE